MLWEVLEEEREAVLCNIETENCLGSKERTVTKEVGRSRDTGAPSEAPITNPASFTCPSNDQILSTTVNIQFIHIP